MDTKIIKSSSAEEPGAISVPGKIIKKEIYQASGEARGIVDAARQEAERILASAEH